MQPSSWSFSFKLYTVKQRIDITNDENRIEYGYSLSGENARVFAYWRKKNYENLNLDRLSFQSFSLFFVLFRFFFTESSSNHIGMKKSRVDMKNSKKVANLTTQKILYIFRILFTFSLSI